MTRLKESLRALIVITVLVMIFSYPSIVTFMNIMFLAMGYYMHALWVIE